MQRKIVDEINCVIGEKNESMTMKDLQEFKFLERVIKEGLRLYTTAPFYERILSEDIDLGKYKLVKNSSVIINAYGVHHNEEYYADPYKFDPDRFLPENLANIHTFAFMPFGLGARNCIGNLLQHILYVL